jgi:PDZ domain-containing protein
VNASASSLKRLAAWVASIVILLSGFFVVPMPLVETAPGDATNVATMIEVAGNDTIHGSLDLLTVRIRQPSIAETIRAVLSDARDLTARDRVIPSDLRRQEYFDLEEQEFRRTFEVAAAVGMRAAGLDVTIRTVPQVVGVLDGGPADGLLRIGDKITRFDGTAVSSAEELAALSRRTTVGDELHLTIRRGDATQDVTVTAGRLPGLEQAGIGVTLQTVEEETSLPVDAELVDQRGIGGPSAGLMMALTVYDLVSAEDLAAGRTIAGTGTIAGDGTVGRIGGIREKTLAAIASGASIMLTPSSQALDARSAADGRIQVIGVDTIDDAVAALRGQRA